MSVTIIPTAPGSQERFRRPANPIERYEGTVVNGGNYALRVIADQDPCNPANVRKPNIDPAATALAGQDQDPTVKHRELVAELAEGRDEYATDVLKDVVAAENKWGRKTQNAALEALRPDPSTTPYN